MSGLVPDNEVLPIPERIIEKIMTDLRAMVRSDNNSPLWKDVRRGDPDDLPPGQMQTPAVYVQDSDDNVLTDLYTQDVVSRDFSIILHIRYPRGQQGVDPYMVFKYYVGKLQALLFAPNYIRRDAANQPLGIMLYELGHSPEVFVGDVQQGGNLILRARYRHERNNPYMSR